MLPSACRLLLFILLVAGSASAQDVQTYLYDAQGRLIGSARGSAAPNSFSGYGYDDADNRLVRYVNLFPKPSTLNQLLPGETMVPGQSLRSPNGQATLVLQADGNLVLYRASGPSWSTGTGTGGSLFLAMQSDGNLVLYGPTYQLVWVQTFGQPDTRLVLQDDCNLVLYNSSGAPLWASQTGC